jgi:uncharacterized protein (TIGR02996 family)
MTYEDAFLNAISHSPNDPLPRLVFADWLEEQGDPRAELIRLLHTLTQSVDVPGREPMEDRLRHLLECGVKPVGPFITNSLGMKFALIPPGTFMMGSPKSEEGRNDDERIHKVTLTKGFLMAIHPVTQAFWRKIMGNNPSEKKGKKLPVESVSWNDCQDFLAKLSEREGHLYRLPTEAEWEFACRAGTTTPYCFGKTITAKHARFWGDLPEITSVGSYPPNAWGLFDMHGNVEEWCADWYAKYPKGEAVDATGPANGEGRVLRGGCFDLPESLVRSAFRYNYEPRVRFSIIGFRVLREAS